MAREISYSMNCLKDTSVGRGEDITGPSSSEIHDSMSLTLQFIAGMHTAYSNLSLLKWIKKFGS